MKPSAWIAHRRAVLQSTVYLYHSRGGALAFQQAIVEWLDEQWAAQHCSTCRSEPDALGPGCDCAHAPCVHDRNAEAAGR